MSDAAKADNLVARLEAIASEPLASEATTDDPARTAAALVQRAKPLVAELVQLGASAVEPLIGLLERGVGLAPLQAAQALGAIGDSRAVEPLLRKLVHSEATPFGVYAVCLGQIGDRRAVEPLIAIFENAEQKAKQEVARLRARYEETVSSSLAGRMGRFLVQGRLAQMDAQLEQDTRALYLRFTANALGMLGDPRAIAPLERRRNDADPRVREAVEQALRQLQAS